MSESVLEPQPSNEGDTLPVIQLPNDPAKKLKAVSSMIRNCLLTANPKLKEIDFKSLQMFVPMLVDKETTYNGQVVIKAIAGNKYKLESRQVFTFTRLDADEFLTSLGLTERVFNKAHFNNVSEWLSKVGTLTVVSGDISTDVGDIEAVFHFGERYRGITPARFIDLGSDTVVKADYSVVFRNQVKFTFTGKPKPVDENAIPEDNDDDLIDIAPFFVNRHLGNVFSSSSSDRRYISRPRTEEDNIRY